MKNINSIFTFNNKVPTSITAIVDNKQYTADSSHPNWQAILAAVRNDNVSDFVNAIDIRSAFQNYVIGQVRIVGNEVWHGNTRLGGVVVDRIFDFMSNNLPVQPIMLFIDKLFQNPSSRAVNELYKFLEHKNLPITSNGNFRAYKGLNPDFYSITAGNLTLISGQTNESGHIFNGVNEVIECIRHQVNDNKDETCSYGLHAGSLEYAKNFAGNGKLVIVEINPADVVSIPSDCNCEKLRTCKYKVVEEYVAPLDSVYVSNGESFNNNPLTTPDDDDIDINDGECDCDCDCETDDDCDCETDDDAFTEGYNDGWTDGNSDHYYDDASESADYRDGYKAGYGDGVNDKDE